MAKRSRRARRLELDKQVQVAPPVTPAPQAAVSNGTSKNVLLDFAEEYYYVYHDLRNVSIVSLLMFVVMIALSFIL